jgi:hypothetical protein
MPKNICGTVTIAHIEQSRTHKAPCVVDIRLRRGEHVFDGHLDGLAGVVAASRVVPCPLELSMFKIAPLNKGKFVYDETHHRPASSALPVTESVVLPPNQGPTQCQI